MTEVTQQQQQLEIQALISHGRGMLSALAFNLKSMEVYNFH